MNHRVLFFLFLSVLAGLNLGTVRKAEDPIRDTQTNPILYEQKKEEEKDGKKGALLYHVRNYPRETFFIDPPFEKGKEPAVGGMMPGEASLPTETASWWEEQPVDTYAPSSSEPVAESVSGPLPEEESVPDLGSGEPPAPETGAENAPTGQGEDYWW